MRNRRIPRDLGQMFRDGFLRYCEQNNFDPGAEMGRLMHDAAGKDAREFCRLAAVTARFLRGVDQEEAEERDVFVIDRRQSAAVAPMRIVQPTAPPVRVTDPEPAPISPIDRLMSGALFDDADS